MIASQIPEDEDPFITRLRVHPVPLSDRSSIPSRVEFRVVST